MKKFKVLAIIMSLCMIASVFTACKQSTSSSTSSSSEPTTSTSETTSEPESEPTSETTSEPNSGTTDGETTEEPVDEYAASKMDEVLSEATKAGLEMTGTIKQNGYNYDGMFKYYTGIEDDSELTQYITSVTADVAQISVHPYQLVFIGVNDVDKLEDVADAAKEGLGWGNWVCVRPDKGMVATYVVPEEDADQAGETKAFVITLLAPQNDSMDMFSPISGAIDAFVGIGNSEVFADIGEGNDIVDTAVLDAESSVESEAATE